MSKEHIIAIDPALEKRISGERRKSTRDALYKLERLIQTLNFNVKYWLDALSRETAFEPESRIVFAYRARLHAAQDYLKDLGELVEPCSCGYCERKRKEETK